MMEALLCSVQHSPSWQPCTYWTRISHVFLFWTAFILTRPLGATVGDFLDKPTSHGGLALSRPLASGVILALILVLILVLPQRPGRHPGSGARLGGASLDLFGARR